MTGHWCDRVSLPSCLVRSNTDAPGRKSLGSDMSRLPTLFIPHGGGPCFFMDWDPPDTWARMADYLRHVPEEAGSSPPKALVVISGHWEEPVVTIQNNPAPSLLYDYHGFPPSTYEIKFPAPGAPQV